MSIDQTRLNTFRSEYERSLRENREQFPSRYSWASDMLPDVVERMMAAVQRGSFNTDSPAVRKACKTLGIKNTYKAIKHYLEGK